MHSLAPRLAPLLLLALTLGACNPRGRECDALHRVLDAAPLADAGAGDATSAAEKALAEIDRIETRTAELADVRGDYRAALYSLVEAGRKNEAALREVLAAATPAGEGPSLDPALGTTALEDVRVLATPCMADLIAGLGIQKSPAAAHPKPDCEKLQAVMLVALRPSPGTSVATYGISLAGALEVARLEDPAMAGAARSLATLLRQSEPALARIKMPAANLLAMAMGLRQAHANLEEAQARAEERASALRKACPAR